MRRLSAGVNGLFTVRYKSMQRNELRKNETMKKALKVVRLTLSSELDL